jgi:hypothetical protein
VLRVFDDLAVREHREALDTDVDTDRGPGKLIWIRSLDFATKAHVPTAGVF